MRTSYVGIDPGVSGGLAAIDEDGLVLAVSKMPATERELLDWLREQRPAIPGGRQARGILEKVHGGIGGPGGRRQGAAGMFTYGRNYGSILMALTAAGIPFDQVAPQTWQKLAGVVYSKNLSQTNKKNISKRRAQQLFPSLTVTHAIADALLLAECCRRINRGLNRQEVSDGETEKQGPVRQLSQTGRARAEGRSEEESCEADEGFLDTGRGAEAAAPAGPAAWDGQRPGQGARQAGRGHRRRA